MRTMKQYGQKPPKGWLTKKARFESWMRFYLTTFDDLSSERQIGMGVGPIPISAVFMYCDRYEFGELVTRDLLYFLRRLDVEYLKWSTEQGKKSEKPKSSSK